MFKDKDRKEILELFKGYNYQLINFNKNDIIALEYEPCNKIGLIISREYLTRVSKKSFIIMTILAPILLAALIVVPVIVANQTQKSMKVMVVDENDFFINRFSDNAKTTFSYRSGEIEVIKKEAIEAGLYEVNPNAGNQTRQVTVTATGTQTSTVNPNGTPVRKVAERL